MSKHPTESKTLKTLTAYAIGLMGAIASGAVPLLTGIVLLVALAGLFWLRLVTTCPISWGGSDNDSETTNKPPSDPTEKPRRPTMTQKTALMCVAAMMVVACAPLEANLPTRPPAPEIQPCADQSDCVALKAYADLDGYAVALEDAVERAQTAGFLLEIGRTVLDGFRPSDGAPAPGEPGDVADPPADGVGDDIAPNPSPGDAPPTSQVTPRAESVTGHHRPSTRTSTPFIMVAFQSPRRGFIATRAKARIPHRAMSGKAGTLMLSSLPSPQVRERRPHFMAQLSRRGR